MTLAKKWIATLWLICVPLIMFMLLILTDKEHNNGITKSWLLTSIVPSLSLIVGVLTFDLLKPEKGKQVDKYLF